MLSRTFSRYFNDHINNSINNHFNGHLLSYDEFSFRFVCGLIALALLILTTTGCTSTSANKHSPTITAAFEEGSSLEQRTSFQVLKVDPIKVEETSLNPSVFTIAEKSLASTLKQKGFVEDTNNPDFYVSYAINLKDKTDLYTVERPRYFYGHLTPSLQGHIESIHIFSYVEGTLIVNLTDGETKESIWQGKAVGAVPEKKANNAGLLKATISDILNELPNKK